MGDNYHINVGADFGKPGFPPRTDVLAHAWYDKWLKGIDNGIEKYGPVTLFQQGGGLDDDVVVSSSGRGLRTPVSLRGPEWDRPRPAGTTAASRRAFPPTRNGSTSDRSHQPVLTTER